jgi:hypothetical protein
MRNIILGLRSEYSTFCMTSFHVPHCSRRMVKNTLFQIIRISARNPWRAFPMIRMCSIIQSIRVRLKYRFIFRLHSRAFFLPHCPPNPRIYTPYLFPATQVPLRRNSSYHTLLIMSIESISLQTFSFWVQYIISVTAQKSYCCNNTLRNSWAIYLMSDFESRNN